MAIPSRADARLVLDARVPRARAADLYLTDEVFLYRLAASFKGGTIELEDCYGLDVVRIQVNELQSRRLRVVAPAS